MHVHRSLLFAVLGYGFVACRDDTVKDQAGPSASPESAIEAGVVENSVVEDSGAEDAPAASGFYLRITSPSSGATVTLSASRQMPITFETNMNLWYARGCADGGPVDCGHAHLTIDGDHCNAPRQLPDGGATKQTYNRAVEKNGADFADFRFCPQPIAGDHIVELELRQDNHAPLNPIVKDALTVHVIVSDADAGADASDASGE